MDYEVATEYFGGLFFGAVMLVAGFALYEGGRHFRSELLRSNLWAAPEDSANNDRNPCSLLGLHTNSLLVSARPC